jgi:hypothetical protein
MSLASCETEKGTKLVPINKKQITSTLIDDFLNRFILSQGCIQPHDSYNFLSIKKGFVGDDVFSTVLIYDKRGYGRQIT